MKIAIATLLGLAGLATGGFAQGQSDAAAATFNSNAPAAAAAASRPQTVSRVIYTPQLPSAQELTNAAAAQGATIERMDQTGNQITVTYRTNSGQQTVVAYQVLPTAGNGAVTNGTTVVTPTSAAPSVVYSSPTVVYTDPYYGYGYGYPYYGYGWGFPVSVGIGFGFHGGGFHGGGFHGGFRR